MSRNQNAPRDNELIRDRRFVPGKISVRAKPAKEGGDPGGEVIEGMAALYNTETVIGCAPWGFREVLLPGCFDEAIAKDDVRGLFNHDPNLILGRNVAKTLELASDAEGLRYAIVPPKTSYASDLLESIGRGDVSGSSFAFNVEDEGHEEWIWPAKDSADLPLRKIKRAKLYDVSPVTYPAYEETTVSLQTRSKATAVAAEIRAKAEERSGAAVGASSARATALRLQMDLAAL